MPACRSRRRIRHLPKLLCRWPIAVGVAWEGGQHSGLRYCGGSPARQAQTAKRLEQAMNLPSRRITNWVSAGALCGAGPPGYLRKAKIMEFQTPKGATITELCIDSSPGGSGTGKKIALRCKYNRAEKNIDLTCSPSLKILNLR